MRNYDPARDDERDQCDPERAKALARVLTELSTKNVVLEQ
jgi:hypothetical protein